MYRYLAMIAAFVAAAPALADPDTGFGAPAMSSADLAAVTGRDDTSLAINARNTSNVAGNSVTGQSETGAISFDSQAFQSLAGLSLLSANTGNNVSINSSLNVNVAIRP